MVEHLTKEWKQRRRTKPRKNNRRITPKEGNLEQQGRGIGSAITGGFRLCGLIEERSTDDGWDDGGTTSHERDDNRHDGAVSDDTCSRKRERQRCGECARLGEAFRGGGSGPGAPTLATADVVEESNNKKPKFKTSTSRKKRDGVQVRD